MGRWEPDARGRLQAAALELFGERGFERATVADIAERAGLTERTFFRHFSDKREVLFAGGEALEAAMVRAVEEAPPSASAMDAVARALEAAGASIPDYREHARRRSSVIEASPELQEREHKKMASLAAAVAVALGKRGVNAASAFLASETGMAVFRVAFARWVAENDARNLTDFLRESLAELRAMAGKA
jgi:AcrR family transcriptional regulator